MENREISGKLNFNDIIEADGEPFFFTNLWGVDEEIDIPEGEYTLEELAEKIKYILAHDPPEEKYANIKITKIIIGSSIYGVNFFEYKLENSVT